ncbi:MAG TPA: chorismate mutase [Clostridia bacterium]|nr:chorismate mutase [Clostridia bacterium]
MDDLKNLRKKIDQLDGEIVEMLNRRFALSVAVGDVKAKKGASVLVTGREEEIKKRLGKASLPEFEKSILGVYERIFVESRLIQETKEKLDG